MLAFKNECIGSLKMPHNFKHNLTEGDSLITCNTTSCTSDQAIYVQNKKWNQTFIKLISMFSFSNGKK